MRLIPFLFSICLFVPSLLTAEERQLSEEISGIATQISRAVGSDACDISGITCLSHPSATSGDAIVIDLYEKLRQAGVSLSAKAEKKISGEYLLASEEISKSGVTGPHAVLRFYLTDGAQLKQFTAIVDNTEDLQQLFSLNSFVSPSTIPEKRNAEILIKRDLKVVDNVWLTNSSAAAEGSDLSMSIEKIEDASNRNVIPIEMVDTTPTVNFKLGDRYRLRLRNDSERNVAASVSIDGLNSFYFHNSQGKKGKLSHYIVPRQSTVTVEGWFIDSSKVNAFRIGYFDEEDSKIKRSSGNISVTYCYAWPSDESPPDRGD